MDKPSLRPIRMDGATRSTTLRMNPSGTAPSSRAVECCLHGTATVVPEDDDERHVEHVNRVLDGTEHRIVEHVTCSAHDEHVAETLVEDDLGGYARITATRTAPLWGAAHRRVSRGPRFPGWGEWTRR